MRTLMMLGFAGVLVGCGPDVVGEWESPEPIQTERNRMTVEEAEVAVATILNLRTVNGLPEAQSFDYEVTWDSRREGDAYSFDMECRESPYGACDVEDDFRMLCELEGDGAALACEVEDNPRWEAYELAWRKVE